MTTLGGTFIIEITNFLYNINSFDKDKTMKRQMIRTLVIAFAMTSLLLVGCDSKETVTNNGTETKVEENVTIDGNISQEDSNSRDVTTEDNTSVEAEVATENPGHEHYGPVTVYGKAGSYVEKWVKDVNTQPEVSFVAQ